MNAAAIKKYSGRVLPPELQREVLQNEAQGTLVEAMQLHNELARYGHSPPKILDRVRVVLDSPSR